MLLETYRKLKNYLFSEVIDIAINKKIEDKYQFGNKEQSNQYVKNLNNKTVLNKSINLIKKERR